MQQAQQLLTIKEASRWASDFFKQNISDSNISYLIQYGKVKKYNGGNSVYVDANDLKSYYASYRGTKEINWKKRLGNDLNWNLSFDHLREKDTTKHVHRLHPYKGKFIPQLVEYFIDNHVDDFKKESFFKAGDIILDPFSGSGTTLVQANEMGMHSIGIDISHFNCLITEVKLLNYDLASLENDITKIRQAMMHYEADRNTTTFENELWERMAEFNTQCFPSPEFKYRVQNRQINEDKYASKKEEEFLAIYNNLVKKYNVAVKQQKDKTFLDAWYIANVRKEIDFAFEQIKKIKNENNKKALVIILSRTIRSCRATTHSDLATLKEPQLTTYYCWKHKKICKPLFSIKYWLDCYATDTMDRLKTFAALKSNTHCMVLPEDSRTVDIFEKIKKSNKRFYEVLQEQKIRGIFTSPPYVGQIDYHEQHAYAYDLFGYERKDEFEIGPLFHGQGAEARASYVEGITNVFVNCKKFMADHFDIFLVANDKYNLYPTIAEKSGLRIVNQYKRPVLNRTERNKSPYSEIIFHMKTK